MALAPPRSRAKVIAPLKDGAIVPRFNTASTDIRVFTGERAELSFLKPKRLCVALVLFLAIASAPLLMGWVLGGAAILLWWLRRSIDVPSPLVVDVRRHLESGQLERAAAVFARANATRPLEDYEKITMAILFLRRGQLGQAIWSLCSAMSTLQARCKGVRTEHAHVLAYAYAVGGDLEEAERLTPRELRHPNSPLHMLLLCKRKRYLELSTLAVSPALRRRLRSCRSPLGCTLLGSHGERVVALLSAFALRMEEQASAAGQPQPSPRVAHRLEAAQPTCADEYDYLQRDWPELQSFLQQHQQFLGTRLRDQPLVPLPRVSVVTKVSSPFNSRVAGINP